MSLKSPILPDFFYIYFHIIALSLIIHSFLKAFLFYNKHVDAPETAILQFKAIKIKL